MVCGVVYYTDYSGFVYYTVIFRGGCILVLFVYYTIGFFWCLVVYIIPKVECMWSILYCLGGVFGI